MLPLLHTHVNETPYYPLDSLATDLERLILAPEETLEVEYKEWLDLGSKSHRAKLAKELIALANHGGGHVVLGFSDPDMRPVPRPSLVSVPAGVTMPIRAKRGAENSEIVSDLYYIRRPGPNSEPPRSGLEWDELLGRCIGNRDQELEALVRRVLRISRSPGQLVETPSSDRIDDLLK